MNNNAPINIENLEVRPALCLDFDGTVRRSKRGLDFHEGTADIELVPGIEEKIWQFRNARHLILGISNQAGVAWGFKSPNQVSAEMDYTLSLFSKNPFHLVKYCFHDAKGSLFPYNYRSLLRKPDIGMLALMEVESFQEGFIIDWDRSLFVGDRPEDEACAKNAGIAFQHISEFLTHG
ncbi:hypothetical protein EHO57_13775 [Leptospira langatensis]|uniref:D,D-heptose 1,7-bisphosphate phosphatase n=1 Tax=Leptospira langatensis TaxID=2484983 RepID=A0A5R2ASV9_9LEPT|nr:hypothetical protein [Leptospira langatensis]TGJ99827.1 hypothetical protein EHO57_13775 [Leptospira langatensis]